MSQYLVLSHVSVQNANSIAGLTWGFPALTQFLGFTHALSRKISTKYEGSYATELAGCAVVSHDIHNKVYQPKKFSDFEFLQSKNPPVLAKHKNSSPPIIEEGKMNLTVSLIIELSNSLSMTTAEINKLQNQVDHLCTGMRLAGGTILNIKNIKLFTASTVEQHSKMLKKIKQLTLPGFVLVDRSEYLQQHYQHLLQKYENNELYTPQIFDAWLDFLAMKFKAVPKNDSNEPLTSDTPADWQYISKPFSGYLIPLMSGFKAISDVYDAGEVLNTRDEVTPTCFVEAIHTVGEWKGVHHIPTLNDVMWRYQHNGQWYLCKQVNSRGNNNNSDEELSSMKQTQSKKFNDALNLF